MWLFAAPFHDGDEELDEYEYDADDVDKVPLVLLDQVDEDDGDERHQREHEAHEDGIDDVYAVYDGAHAHVVVGLHFLLAASHHLALTVHAHLEARRARLLDDRRLWHLWLFGNACYRIDISGRRRCDCGRSWRWRGRRRRLRLQGRWLDRCCFWLSVCLTSNNGIRGRYWCTGGIELRFFAAHCGRVCVCKCVCEVSLVLMH